MAGGRVAPGGGPSPVLVLEDADLAPPGRTSPLLSGVTLTLRRGESAVLLGGNGSGKTTLLRSAAGLWPLRDGRRSVPEGTGYHAASVGVVLEDPSAQFVAGTVREELEFVLENRGTAPEAIAERVGEWLARYDLETLQGRDPRGLSPGEQERCLLAAATLLDPPLLLLDDAFLYLGPGEAPPLWKRLRAAVRERKTGAVLLACHDAELAVDADRVGILRDGTLAAWGPPGEVLRGDLPPSVEPALGVWLERTLRGRGWKLPGDRLDPEGMALRLRGEIET